MAENTISLLDMAGQYHVKWYVLYMCEDNQEWWNRFLKPGFRHVQLWKPVQYGPCFSDRMWLVVDPGLEHVDTKLDYDPTAPWGRIQGLTVQSVNAVVPAKKVREYFFFGPITCVEMVKAHLGIKARQVKTPWQLYKYISKNNHQLIIERAKK